MEQTVEKIHTLKINLDKTQAALAAKLGVGDEMVIVVPIPKDEQPSDDKTLKCPLPYGNRWWLFENSYSSDSPYREQAFVIVQHPIGSTVLGREAWAHRCYTYAYKADGEDTSYFKEIGISRRYYWRSAQCQPVKAIRHQFTVTGNRVCKVQEIDITTMIDAIDFNVQVGFNGQDVINEFASWFNSRFGKGAWEADPYVEVVTMRKVERE